MCGLNNIASSHNRHSIKFFLVFSCYIIDCCVNFYYYKLLTKAVTFVVPFFDSLPRTDNSRARVATKNERENGNRTASMSTV